MKTRKYCFTGYNTETATFCDKVVQFCRQIHVVKLFMISKIKGNSHSKRMMCFGLLHIHVLESFQYNYTDYNLS